jgi:hypothetical protein
MRQTIPSPHGNEFRAAMAHGPYHPLLFAEHRACSRRRDFELLLSLGCEALVSAEYCNFIMVHWMLKEPR